ncbi:MAG: hypothetical protein IAF94_16110, partial [Pirellulaceae bacterium]|nr:hypothetical protein [Pirellulaceae bacterium]
MPLALRFLSHPREPAMSVTRTSKWTAFLLSACVPGAGQLAAGSWSCLAWFAAAGLLVAGWAYVGQILEGPAEWLLPLQLGAGMALCLLSAEHAKRLLEGRNQKGACSVVASSICFSQSSGRKVDIEIVLDVARSRGELWNLISDLPRFLTIDPFHDQITLMRVRPAIGVDLVLSHNALGRRFLRFGKIIAWRDGSGYTFSDLSPRGPKQGFPHVFMIDLQSLSVTPEVRPLIRLTIHVRGRWTSRLAPVWLGRLWVWLVVREHARLLRKG